MAQAGRPRLGLAHAKDVLKTEEQLMEAIPKDKWSQAHHWLIWHGRRVCSARKPACERCPGQFSQHLAHIRLVILGLIRHMQHKSRLGQIRENEIRLPA